MSLTARSLPESSSRPSREPFPPQRGHTLCACLGAVSAWFVRDGPDRNHKLFGATCDVAAHVQQDILKQHHLDGVAGVRSNKLVSQTDATLVEPSELYDV